MLDHLFINASDVARSIAFYEPALAPPGARLHCDPHCYAANLLDPDGYSIGVIYKSGQHAQQP